MATNMETIDAQLYKEVTGHEPHEAREHIRDMLYRLRLDAQKLEIALQSAHMHFVAPGKTPGHVIPDFHLHTAHRRLSAAICALCDAQTALARIGFAFEPRPADNRTDHLRIYLGTDVP